jgi:hypothetical protein
VAVSQFQGVTTYPRELLLSGLADALPDWQKAGNRILLTSRPYGLDEAGLHRLGLERAPLEPLPRPLQDLFVARWFDTLGETDVIPDLIAAIHDRDDLAPLVENPMLLTALCVLYDSGGRLPQDRYGASSTMCFIVDTRVTLARESRCCGASKRSPMECTQAATG